MFVRPGRNPAPGHIDKTEGGRSLYGGRERAEDECQPQLSTRCEHQAGHEKRHHERVVVRPSDQRQDYEWVQCSEHDGLATVPTERASETWKGECQQRHGRKFQEAQIDRGEQLMVMG